MITTRTVPAPLPAELQHVVDAYRTCEFVTVTRSGVPIAWPTAALYRPESGTFLITTSIALPRKAVNVRRDPRVGLLFSEPTGSGLAGAPQVHVTGIADCPDQVVTSPEGLEAYWTRLYERQPAGRVYSANALTRWAFDWYYMRLLITVTPTSVERRAPLAVPAPGAAGTSSPAAGSGAFREVARRLPAYPSAVLTTMDGDGPRLCRVRATADAQSGSVLVRADDESVLRPGTAGLLCHGHDERLWGLRSFAAVGDLDRDAHGTWRFTPARFVAGADTTGPVGAVRTLREVRGTARRYLDARGLPRPDIPWAGYAALKAEVERREAIAAR